MGSEIAHKRCDTRFWYDRAYSCTAGLGLKMQVIAYDPFVTPEYSEELGIESVSWMNGDTGGYLTLHCPLIEKTRGIIGSAQLAMMKKEAMLINCARGGLIN